ncbi:MAG: hypothetical protein HY296_03615, partial [Thaumarchaeota archaeon]|nr:hypothetical protein [Nitrososphaerota archaeon]
MTDDVKIRIFTGQLSRKNESWEQAKNQLKTTESTFKSPEVFTSTVGKVSPYHALFDKGADIYPRRLWFVKIAGHEVLGLSQEQPFVQTEEAVKGKPPWESVRIAGAVERKFLFATALGDDLVPFGILHYKPIVLPILVSNHRVSIIEGSRRARSLGYPG